MRTIRRIAAILWIVLKWAGRNADKLTAIAALVGLILFGAQTMRHERLSVRPMLRFEIEHDGESGSRGIGLHIINVGLGPALLNDQAMHIDAYFSAEQHAEIERHREWGSLFVGLMKYLGNKYSLEPDAITALASTNGVIRNDETLTLIALDPTLGDDPVARELMELLALLEITVWYQSMYEGQTWTLTFDVEEFRNSHYPL